MRIARLDDEAVPFARCNRFDQVGRAAVLDRPTYEAACIAIPDAVVVVGVDDWSLGAARLLDRGDERGVPPAKRIE